MTPHSRAIGHTGSTQPRPPATATLHRAPDHVVGQITFAPPPHIAHGENAPAAPASALTVATRPLDATQPTYLSQGELAARWRKSVHTIERYRIDGVGPIYLKIGGKVLYRLVDIERFERACLYASPQERASVDEGFSDDSDGATASNTHGADDTSTQGVKATNTHGVLA